MAGIDNLVKGAVGTLAKDKVASYLSPAQMDFITFALNPQGYLLDKGVNAAANALGYGSQYRELKGGAQDDKEWYKEVMRDTIGDALPGSIGDFVRATPRNTETDNTPAGMYYDPNVGDFVQSSNPIPVNSARFENTIRDMEYGTQIPGQGKFVGALPEDNAIFQANVSNLPYDLNSIPVDGLPQDLDVDKLRSVIYGPAPEVGPQPELVFSPGSGFTATSSGGGDMNAPATESFAPMDFGGAMDYSDVFGSSYGGFGGGGGSKGNIEDYGYSQYKRGGQVCGCKH